MIIDCDTCPGRHLPIPACPTCVVRMLLDRDLPVVPGSASLDLAFTPMRSAVAGSDRMGAVPVELMRRTDDHGAPLDAREQRAVAVLTSRGLLAGVGTGPATRRAARRPSRPRTA